jgi:nucleoside-diphosphate-sugar epimerase
MNGNKTGRVVIVGGTGFLGKNLVAEFQKKSYEPIVVARNSNSRHAKAQISFDLSVSPIDLSYLPVDLVINCAASISHSRDDVEYDAQLSSTFKIVRNLVRSKFGGPPPKLIQIGSNSEYGDSPCPQSPESGEKPNTPYGIVKLMSSLAAQAADPKQFRSVTIARPYLLFGDGQSSQSFLESVIQSCREGKPFYATGCEQTRDFIDVKTAAAQIFELATTESSVPAVANICTGVETSLKWVIEKIKLLRPDFQYVLGSLPYRKSEIMRSFGLPWQPLNEYRAKAAIQDYIEARLKR